MTASLTDHVAAAAPHSDLTRETMLAYGELFREAHARAAGGPSIEIGTRAGGSALLWLRLLDDLYERAPLLVTVDPYGDKPYLPKWPGHLYGDGYYTAAKLLLSEYPNHAHFLLRSEDFLERLIGVSYWQDGRRLALTGFTFAFLDGDHAAANIARELDVLVPLMRPGAIVIVDNADWADDVSSALRARGGFAVERGWAYRL